MLKRLACVVMILAMSGCATIPTSGEVDSQPRQVPSEALGGAKIFPDAPPQGASSAQIVEGFLTAMASFQPGYETAREYLTVEAAQAWHPESGVLVYTKSPRVNDNQVTISGTIVGQLDADASFTGGEGEQWVHDFGMVRQGGEWRISNPPPGLALSQYMFSQSFTRIEAYFFADSSKILVPDQRYVQLGAWNETAAARFVLEGPSAWLTPVIDSSYRTDFSLDGDVSVDADGVATIPLASTAGTVDVSSLTPLALEMAATMRSVAGVSRIKLMIGDDVVPLNALNGALGDGSLPLSEVNSYDLTQVFGTQHLFFASDGLISQLDTTPVLLRSEWGTMSHELTSFAVRRGADLITATTDEGLLVGAVRSGQVRLTLEAQGMLKPQFDSNGTLWAMSNAEGAIHAWAGNGATLTEVATPGLAGVDVRGFQVSADGRRMLIISQPADSSARMELSVALIRYEYNRPQEITSLRTISVGFQGATFSSLIDVAWVGASSILLLGAVQADSAPEVFLTDLDGLTMTEWGNPGRAEVVEMATHVTQDSQQITVRDINGRVWDYQEDNHQWVAVRSKVTAIAYPA